MRTLLRTYKVSRLETFPGKVGSRLHLIIADENATAGVAEAMPLRLAIPVESHAIDMNGTYDAFITNVDDSCTCARNAQHDIEVLHATILDIVEDGLGLQVPIKPCPTTADQLQESRRMLHAYAKRFHEHRIEASQLESELRKRPTSSEVERDLPFDSDAASRVLARLRAHFPNEKHGRIGDYVTALLDRVEAAALEVGSNEWHQHASWAAYAGAAGMLRASQERERITQHHRELAVKELEELQKDRATWREHTASLTRQIAIARDEVHEASMQIGQVRANDAATRRILGTFGIDVEADDGLPTLRRALAIGMRTEWVRSTADDEYAHGRKPGADTTYCGKPALIPAAATRAHCVKCGIAADIWDAQLGEIAGKL